MKVYVVEKGEYSDRHVIGVTLDEEKAKYVVEEGNNRERKTFWYSTDYAYTEFEMDKFDELYNLYKNNYKLFRVWKDLENKQITITEAELGDYYLDEIGIVRKSYWDNYLYVFVLTNTEEKALKIASDKFAEYEYENME